MLHTLVASLQAVGLVRRAANTVLPWYRNMASKSVKGIHFNSKHLKRGDPLPPYNGKLRLYNMRYCPYAQRTVLALNAKGIEYEIVNINLVEKPEWLTQKSAFGKVPALEIKEGVSIYESLVTVEYLDDVYPQRPLLSKDPVQKAFDKIIIEASGPIHSLFYRLLKVPESVTEDVVESYHKALDFIQEQLKARGTKFLGGELPGYVDYMIWPWFERVLVMQKDESKLRIEGEKYKSLLDYLNNMKKDPVVAEYLVPDDILRKFVEQYKVGGPINYELMN